MISAQLGHFVQRPAGSSRFLPEVNTGLEKIPMEFGRVRLLHGQHVMFGGSEGLP